MFIFSYLGVYVFDGVFVNENWAVSRHMYVWGVSKIFRLDCRVRDEFGVGAVAWKPEKTQKNVYKKLLPRFSTFRGYQGYAKMTKKNMKKVPKKKKPKTQTGADDSFLQIFTFRVYVLVKMTCFGVPRRRGNPVSIFDVRFCKKKTTVHKFVIFHEAGILFGGWKWEKSEISSKSENSEKKVWLEKCQKTPLFRHSEQAACLQLVTYKTHFWKTGEKHVFKKKHKLHNFAYFIFSWARWYPFFGHFVESAQKV